MITRIVLKPTSQKEPTKMRTPVVIAYLGARENILGVLLDDRCTVQVLRASVLRGAPNIYTITLPTNMVSKIREARETDFDDFNVSSKGHFENTEPLTMETKTASITTRIANASNPGEVDNLLAKLRKGFAQPRTIRKAERVAAERKAFFAANPRKKAKEHRQPKQEEAGV